MGNEQKKNNSDLTQGVSVYTFTPCMGRPPKSKDQRRIKLFTLKLNSAEKSALTAASRKLGISVAEIFRRGAAIYIERDKDGSSQKEKKK